MIEEPPSMEKKNCSRTAAAGPSKNNGADAKAKQDVVANKFSRTGRRRESPCPLRPEPARKPNAQRARGFDKRSKPRGAQGGDRDRSDIVQVPKAEIGSALHQGSKKLNLNHLLNFTYSPRATNSRPSYWGNSWKNRNKWSTKKHKYNKEQFLQANCQFIVKAGGDYSVHAVNPDPLVDWDAVELVRVPGHEVASCPICLYDPVAAKITRCGHIYCWACILHYLALTDRSWQKCPICFEAIHKKDLKSVTSLSTHAFMVGETITMRLMQRIRGSVFAMAKSQWKGCRGEFLNLGEANDGTCFSKLLIASPEQVIESIITRERKELENAFALEKDCPESCFIESALTLLKERERDLLKNKPCKEYDDKIMCNDTDNMSIQLANGRKPVVYSSAFSDEEMESDVNNGRNDIISEPCEVEPAILPVLGSRQRYESLSMESTNSSEPNVDDLDLHHLSLDDNADEKNSNHTYYFYQATDGQHIYMHALNIRMLIKQYGQLDNCPETITAKIVEKEDVSMNEELRKRLRYLGHLPLTCEFEIVELSMKPPAVMQDTVEFFKDEIDRRRHRRNKRARDERKRENFIREEENRKWGRFPGAHLNLSSHRQFPDYLVPNETLSNTNYGEQTNVISPADAPDLARIEHHDDGHSTPSFAQMLREGKAKMEAASQPPLTSNSPSEATPNRLRRNDGDSDPEDYVPVPEYHLSFGNAIQEMLKRTPDVAVDSMEGADIGKKKKKRNKSTLLFTTCMARNK